MMSDSKVAKLLLSAIIGEKIIDLAFDSKEYVYRPDADKEKKDLTLEYLTVCYLDFKANIETEEGKYKTVIIELQKAKVGTDIMRFRRYLGSMYQSAENTYDEERKRARQIYCIYFLNYEIGLPDSPVIKVDYKVKDLATGAELKKKSEFIESLNHLSWIVQVRHLKEKRRNELEDLLTIFDQDNITGNRHILEIDEKHYPEKYRPIMRKLQEAYASQEVRDSMQVEDDYISELLELQKEVVKKREEIVQKDKEILKSREEIVQKDKEIVKSREEIVKSREEIVKSREEIVQKDKEIVKSREEIVQKDEEIVQKDKENEKLKEENEKLKKLLEEQNK
jgi:hypothetical protein